MACAHFFLFNGGVRRRRWLQIVFGRRTVHVLAKSKSDKTRHHQPGPGYHHPMRSENTSFPLRLQLPRTVSNGFQRRSLEVGCDKNPRFARFNKSQQSTILLGRPICSAVLHSHQKRDSPVFVFGPGRERANLILSMRARLRIDE
jgi:hypothetical protein